MNRTFHCMFEQSGTFKNEFKKLGYEAFDYDILNDFNETDFQIDLFQEIKSAYERERETIFDRIAPNDMILAFFPCIRFEDQALLLYRGEHSFMKNWTDRQKMEYDLEKHKELHELYELITKLVIVCIDRSIPLIIENPYSTQHYLHRYWGIKPKYIDKNRNIHGDYFKKPTQYFFVNCEPKNNLILEAYSIPEIKKIKKVSQVERSMISPEYANRFIRENILDMEEIC